MRSIQIEDDEMEMSDDERDYPSCNSKRVRYDTDNLKEENDSLRCQLEAARNEMSMERTDIKYTSDFREKQIKVLQETIRNMQTQLLQTRMREQKDIKTIEQLERKLKESGVKQLLLKTKIRETTERLKDKEVSSVNSEASELSLAEDEKFEDVDKKVIEERKKQSQDERQLESCQVIDIDLDKSDDDVRIIENPTDIVEIQEDTYLEEKLLINDQDQKSIKQKESKDNNDSAKECKNPVDTKNLDKSEKVKSLALPLQIEAKIIALTSAYLLVQPYGVESSAICTYINDIMRKSSSTLQLEFLECVLQKYNNLFQANQTPAIENTNHSFIKWKFCGFNEDNLIE